MNSYKLLHPFQNTYTIFYLGFIYQPTLTQNYVRKNIVKWNLVKFISMREFQISICIIFTYTQLMILMSKEERRNA